MPGSRAHGTIGDQKNRKMGEGKGIILTSRGTSLKGASALNTKVAFSAAVVASNHMKVRDTPQVAAQGVLKSSDRQPVRQRSSCML